MKAHLTLPKDFFSSVNRLSISRSITMIILTLCLGISPAWGAKPAAKQGAVIYVDSSAPADGDGMSWEAAFTDLQDALDEAVSGDQIWVTSGTYTPHASDRSVSFSLKSGIAIYGGFAGDEKQLKERQMDPSLTILSGDIGTSGDDTDNSYHVVYADGVTGAVLDGFTVTGGRGDGNSLLRDDFNVYYYAGAGMYTSNSLLTVANCIFRDNKVAVETPLYVYGHGAGMYNLNSAPIITNCTFIDNQAGDTPNDSWGRGGGMYNEGGFITDENDTRFPLVTHCTFSENVASSSTSNPSMQGFGGGGGMYNKSCNLTVDGCTFTGNSGGSGGAMLNFYKYPTITNCIFNTNFNTHNDGVGGAIYNLANVTNIINCTFYQNGYRLMPQSSWWRITRLGGAIYDGLEGRGPRATISNCIFSENADRGSGAVFSAANYHAPTTLTNCLFYKNKIWEGYNPSQAVISHVDGNVDVVNAMYDIDPLLVDPAGGDFHLSYDSPCIDAGYAVKYGKDWYSVDNYPMPSKDFEVENRIVDSDGDGVPAADIGVDEFIPNLPDLGWFLQDLADGGDMDEATAARLLSYVDDAQDALDQNEKKTAINILKTLIADAWASVGETETAQVIEMKTEAVIEEI